MYEWQLFYYIEELKVSVLDTSCQEKHSSTTGLKKQLNPKLHLLVKWLLLPHTGRKLKGIYFLKKVTSMCWGFGNSDKKLR